MAYTVKQDSVIMGVTEFRNNIPNLLKNKSREKKIIITNRDKPLGVLIDFNEYQKIQDFLEIAEDMVLSEMAKKSMTFKGRIKTQKEMEKQYGI